MKPASILDTGVAGNVKGNILDGRLAEIVFMTGFVLIAVPFALAAGPGQLSGLLARSALLVGATFCLYFSAYSINSWLGWNQDRLNPRLSCYASTLPARLATLAAASAVLSLGGFALLSYSHASIAAVCLTLAAAYSHARGAKSTPFAGTLVHLVAQPLLFHLGYLSFAPFSLRSQSLSVFFALLFAGGHLMHELKDYEADLASGLRTNAVRFGRERMTLAYRIAVSLSLAYWVAIHTAGLLPAGTFAPFGVAAGVHAVACWVLPASGFKSQRTIVLFQRAYRFAYLVAGGLCFL